MKLAHRLKLLRDAGISLVIWLLTCTGAAHAGVRATYYNGPTFSGAGTETFPQTIDFDWGQSAPVAGVGADNFSVRFAGQLTPNATANYELCVVADDGVRLFVNGYRLIDDWNDTPPRERCGTLALTAGQSYWLQLDYYENGGGALVRLLWSSPTLGKQVIPASALSCCSDRGGVGGVYFPNADLDGSGVGIGARQINFDWRTASPIPGQARVPFSMRWRGNFTPRFNDSYTLYITVAGGVRVRLNGQTVLESLGEIVTSTYQVFAQLNAGVGYDIEIDYVDRTDDAVLRLEWSSANQRREVIPTGAFFAQFGFGGEIDGSSFAPEFNSATAVNVAGSATGTFRGPERANGGATFTSNRSIDATRANFPAPETVYQSERWGTFTLRSPVLAQGRRYRVRLHFSEIYWGVAGLGGSDTGAGTRLIDVSINGQPVLHRFDIFRAAGGANRAVVRDFETSSNSMGEISIEFKASAGSPDPHAKVSGIEYIQIGF
jgi:hypothetical protein